MNERRNVYDQFRPEARFVLESFAVSDPRLVRAMLVERLLTICVIDGNQQRRNQALTLAERIVFQPGFALGPTCTCVLAPPPR